LRSPTSTSLGFADLVEEHLGLHAEVPTSREWERVLQNRLGATRSPDFDAYCQRLGSARGRKEEVGQLAQMITIGETYFFRDSRQFEALTTAILPELLNRRSNGTKVSVLSVACSTGEEPYSVAIAARELLGYRAERVEVCAFDINPAAIAAAQKATYSEWALRATPAAIRDRYFVRKANQYALAPTIREAVHFEVRNLFDADPEFWQPGRFDVILCRNALIYFSRRKIVDALKRFTESLSRDGTLLLGNAESPRGYGDGLVAQELCGSFCYRLASDKPMPDSFVYAPIQQPPVEKLEGADCVPFRISNAVQPDDNGAWVAAIDAATQRLATLVQTKSTVERTQTKREQERDVNDLLSEARTLMQGERFAEALLTLDKIVAMDHEPSEVHLLRASILTNQGRFNESVDLCHRLVVDYPHCAGAYHLLGVAYEQLGKFDEARAQHEKAITLDCEFSMSYWFLGRLLLRAGQRDAARRYLGSALDLWRRESSKDGSLQLYAGGFGRETLERLCRADLAKCEVRR
jgi:chemotaxis protein methyltransferase CheR